MADVTVYNQLVPAYLAKSCQIVRPTVSPVHLWTKDCLKGPCKILPMKACSRILTLLCRIGSGKQSKTILGHSVPALRQVSSAQGQMTSPSNASRPQQSTQSQGEAKEATPKPSKEASETRHGQATARRASTKQISRFSVRTTSASHCCNRLHQRKSWSSSDAKSSCWIILLEFVLFQNYLSSLRWRQFGKLPSVSMYNMTGSCPWCG